MAKMYVAAVKMKNGGMKYDYAWTGANKGKLVADAMTFVEAQKRAGYTYGDIYVGELTHKVAVPVPKYEVVPLEEVKE